MMYGMGYEEFWHESIDRYADYWQKFQFEREKRNQELWLQGIYFMESITSAFDSKRRHKYPDKPHRITELTEVEKELEKKRMVEDMRQKLMEHKRRWDAKRKGGG